MIDVLFSRTSSLMLYLLFGKILSDKRRFLDKKDNFFIITWENKTEAKKEHYKLIKDEPVNYLNIFGKYYKKYTS